MNIGGLRTRFLLSLAFGVTVVIGLFLYGEFSGVASSIGDFRWSYLPVILGLTLFNYTVRFFKWQFYLKVSDIRGVPFFESVLIFCSGLAMTITPAKLGEWIKSYYLRTRHGIDPSRSAPIVLAERMTDGFGMILLAAGGLFLFRQGWLFVIAVSLLGAFVVAVFRFRPFSAWTVALAEKIPFLRRHTGFIAGFYETAFTLFSPKVLALSVAMGVVSWLAEGIALYYVFLGLGAENSWELAVQAIFILSVVTLAGAVLLLPGGLGAAETGITGLAQTMVGLGRDAAAASTLLIRICTLWFGIAVGVVALVALSRMPNRFQEPTPTSPSGEAS